MTRQQTGQGPVAAVEADGWVQHAFALTRHGRADEARHWMERAAAGGHRQAPVFAAIWRLVGYAGPVDAVAAAALLHVAVQNGEPLGYTMLAALAVSDLQGRRDWSRALSLLIDAAKQGEPRAMSQLALLLPGEDPARRALMHAAAARGDGAARYFHGRTLCESADAQMRAEGWRWVTDMARRGEPCSRLFMSRHSQHPSVGDPDASLPPHAFDWQGIGARVVWPHERPVSRVMPLRSAPRIAAAQGLLIRDECEYLMSRGAPYLQPAQVGGPGGAAVSSVRTNDSMLFTPGDTDVVVQSIDSLVARALDSPAENGERLAMLRYQPGQSYAPHCDWIDPTAPGKAEIVAGQGQRIATLLVYLNDDYEAGETRFVRLDWAYKGGPGDALLWSNVTPDGAVDPATLHAGLAPTAGEKWLLSKWMRNRSQAPVA